VGVGVGVAVGVTVGVAVGVAVAVGVGVGVGDGVFCVTVIICCAVFSLSAPRESVTTRRAAKVPGLV
jgi:hypothetical protein